MFVFRSTKIVIEQKSLCKFELTWMSFEFTGGFAKVNGQDQPVRHWVKQGKPIELRTWMEVQTFLDENVDLEDIQVCNRTDYIVNFAEISKSGRRHY